jgi:hypothetical protein
MGNGEWKVCPPFATRYFAIRASAGRSSLRQHRDAGEEQVASHPDQHEIDQEHDGPAEIVANDFAFVLSFASSQSNRNSLFAMRAFARSE